MVRTPSLLAAALWCAACSPSDPARGLADAAPAPDAPDPVGGNDLSRSYAAATKRVEARANVFAAGLASASAAGGGALPVAFNLAELGGPTELQMLVVGHKVSCCGVFDFAGADGNTGLASTILPAASDSKLSGIVHHSRNMFLTGVFLPAPGTPLTPPATLHFHNPRDADRSPHPADSIPDTQLAIAPALGQLFFIGDGRGVDAAGALTQQRFMVPANAATLYLGFADATNLGDPILGPSPGKAGSYGDNTGEVTVHLGTRYHGIGAGDLACAPGATTATLEQQAHQLAAQAGATSTHVSFDWVNIEPNPPNGATHTFTWTATDAQVERALAAGLEPFAFTGNVPNWLMPSTCTFPVPEAPTCATPASGPGPEIRCQGHRSFPDQASHPDAEAHFTKFFTELGARYCHRVHFFEFWNEENGCGSPAEDCGGARYVEDYVFWLARWYSTMKAACPDTVLAVGGLACENLEHPEYCKDYLVAINNVAAAKGLGTIYDAVSLHPYGSLDLSQRKPIHWEVLRMVDQVLTATDKKIWLDEWGYNPRPASPPTAGSTEEVQAKAVGERDKVAAIGAALSGMAATRYDRVIEMRYLTMTDLPGAWWGLADWDGAMQKLVPRASYCALCRALHGGASCTGCPAP